MREQHVINRRKKAVLLVIISLMIVIGFAFYNIHISAVNYNERVIDRQIARLIASDRDERWLSNIAFFTWNHAYVFQAGTTRNEIEKIIGFSDANIPRVVREGYAQILFVSDGLDELYDNSVRANVHGRKPYRLYVEGFGNENYVRLNQWARLRVEVEDDGTIIVIINQNPFMSWENMGVTRYSFQNYLERVDSRVKLYVDLINEIYHGDFNRDFWFPDIAAFLWDYAYAFSAGTTRSEIEAIIGIKCEDIPDVIVAGYTQMLFVNTAWGDVISIHDVLPYTWPLEYK